MRGGKDVDRDDWYWRVFEEVPDVNLVSVTECAWTSTMTSLRSSALSSSVNEIEFSDVELGILIVEKTH